MRGVFIFFTILHFVVSALNFGIYFAGGGGLVNLTAGLLGGAMVYLNYIWFIKETNA